MPKASCLGIAKLLASNFEAFEALKFKRVALPSGLPSGLPSTWSSSLSGKRATGRRRARRNGNGNGNAVPGGNGSNGNRRNGNSPLPTGGGRRRRRRRRRRSPRLRWRGRGRWPPWRRLLAVFAVGARGALGAAPCGGVAKQQCRKSSECAWLSGYGCIEAPDACARRLRRGPAKEGAPEGLHDGGPLAVSVLPVPGQVRAVPPSCGPARPRADTGAVAKPPSL